MSVLSYFMKIWSNFYKEIGKSMMMSLKTEVFVLPATERVFSAENFICKISGRQQYFLFLKIFYYLILRNRCWGNAINEWKSTDFCPLFWILNRIQFNLQHDDTYAFIGKWRKNPWPQRKIISMNISLFSSSFSFRRRWTFSSRPYARRSEHQITY